MNINAISTGFQPAKVYNTVNFKGAQKAASQLINTGIAHKTASKTVGIKKSLSKISHGIKNTCSKVFSTIKKSTVSTFKFVNKWAHNAFNAVKSTGKKISGTVSDFFKGIKNKNYIKITQTNSGNSVNTIIQAGNNKSGKNTLTVSVKNDNIIIINGKIYKYGGKLPDGIQISSNGSFSVKGANKTSNLSRKIQDFAKTVKKNGKLIGTEA